MKQAIVNFCKSMDTGLFLLDMPTGFGKTYSVLDFMVDNYDAPEFKDKKIFFVTTLKKNLPDKELREHFAKRGKADDYDKYCLRIEANADMVVEKLDELYRARKIPAAITMKQEFKDLHGSVKLLNEYRDKKRELKGTSKDIINVLCKNAEDAIRKQQEGAFRKVIESELKQFRTPKEKLKNIANNPEYHWIGELYPAVYTRAKRIFFMSMDKFFLGNTTIIEPTYSFYNNDITKNAIIFIDEFDATRDRLLNQIITRGLENHIDYLGLFHRVYASLKTRDFPAELTTASKLQQAYLDEQKNAKNPMEIIEGFGGVFDETYNRFAMQYSFKTEEDGKGDRSRNFIFNDLQFHSVFEGENAFIDIDTDMKAKQNWFYSDSEVDPHQESMEDYVVQHITVENFKHQSSAAVYNILKELVIKKDIAIGKITLVDWSQYGYKADWLFGVVVDGTYYFMTIHPDGSFKIEALKRNLFTMTEYDKYMDYFGLNEENKNDYRGVIGLVKDAEGNINLIKDTNMYSMPDYTAMGDVLKNVASEGRFPGKDVVTWLRLVMDTTDKIKVHAELDIVIPHIDVNAEYTKANVMGLFKGITTKKEVVRYVFENTGIMLYAYLRGEEERREYLSGNIDINYFDYDDTHAKYSVGEIGNGMKYTIERASVVREIQAVEGSKLIFKKVLPLMGVEFVRYGMLTVVPFPFKYLREYIVKEEKSV